MNQMGPLLWALGLSPSQSMERRDADTAAIPTLVHAIERR
jgi:hypothetical protein